MLETRVWTLPWASSHLVRSPHSLISWFDMLNTIIYLHKFNIIYNTNISYWCAWLYIMLHDRICSIIFNIMIFCVKYYITYLYIVWQCLLNCYISDHVMYLLVYVLLYSLLYSLLCCLINKIQHTMVYDMSYNTNFTVCIVNV